MSAGAASARPLLVDAEGRDLALGPLDPPQRAGHIAEDGEPLLGGVGADERAGGRVRCQTQRRLHQALVRIDMTEAQLGTARPPIRAPAVRQCREPLVRGAGSESGTEGLGTRLATGESHLGILGRLSGSASSQLSQHGFTTAGRLAQLPQIVFEFVLRMGADGRAEQHGRCDQVQEPQPGVAHLGMRCKSALNRNLDAWAHGRSLL
ncbi:MAG: hypothetical protein U1F49_04605 [Rubrivivax sp.]